MYLWETDIQESVVFKPIEIRTKRGRKRKKVKKMKSAIYIPNMDAENFKKICDEKGLKFVYIEVQPHGRLIDVDELANSITGAIYHSDLRDAPTIIPADLVEEE